MDLHFKLKWWPFRNIRLISTDWGRGRGRIKLDALLAAPWSLGNWLILLSKKMIFQFFSCCDFQVRVSCLFPPYPICGRCLCVLWKWVLVCVCVLVGERVCVCVHRRGWECGCACACDSARETERKAITRKRWVFLSLHLSKVRPLIIIGCFFTGNFFRFLGSSGIKPVFYGGTTLTRSS